MAISEQPISSAELCSFFFNGFVNGFINAHEVITNIKDITENIEVVTATWKLGFETGLAVSLDRRN